MGQVASRNESAERTPVDGTVTLDVVDLMYELADLRAPDTFVDQVIEVLVARGDFRKTIRPVDVRFNSWLAPTVLAYTSDESAMNILAHRIGYRLSTAFSGNLFVGVATEVNTGRNLKAFAHTRNAAGILALLRMAFTEGRDV